MFPRHVRLVPLLCGLACAIPACQSSRPGADRRPMLDHLWQPPADVHSGRVKKVVGIAPGETVQLADIAGPGVIRHIWFTCQSSIPQIHGLLVLRMQWDDEPDPSVVSPLGDFFGVGFGKERRFKSLMADSHPAGGDNHAALNCYWPMPFAERARISIENRSHRAVSMFFVHVDYERVDRLPPNALYFHAHWRRENPVRLRVPYTILEAKGRGCYVGTVMNYHLLQPGPWVEGGDDFYIDGDERPTLPGTGAEDYFGLSWGFRPEDNALVHGTSYGPKDDRMTAYRWHVPDPVYFDRSLRVVMRCYGWKVGHRQDDYASVAFWYQTEPHAPLPPLPPPDYDYLGVAEEYRHPVADWFSPERLPPPPPGRNLTPTAVAVRASGHYNDETKPQFALDGNLSTKWCDDPGTELAWLALDLGTAKTITGVVLKNASAAGDTAGFDTSAFRIDVADAFGGPWRTVAEVDNDRAPPDPEYGTAVDFVTFDEPVRGRWVRLTITRACLVDAIARVQEFELYGRE